MAEFKERDLPEIGVVYDSASPIKQEKVMVVPCKDSDGYDAKCRLCHASPKVDPYALRCGHVFCFECVYRWGQTRPKCPVCKRAFSNYVLAMHRIVECNRRVHESTAYYREMQRDTIMSILPLVSNQKEQVMRCTLLLQKYIRDVTEARIELRDIDKEHVKLRCCSRQ